MDDKELIKLCIKGKNHAQKHLYDHFAPKLFAQCLRYAKDHPEACDLLQESFIAIFKNLDAFRFESPLIHWMRRITSNASIRFISKNRKLQFESDINETQANNLSDQNKWLEDEDAAYILDMLNDLPEGYRLVFNLHVIEGFAHTEIADMLGIDAGTSRSQLYKAKMQLKKRINHWNKAV